MTPPRRDAATTTPATVTTGGGASLSVHDLGGGGPPLVMVHATSFHGRVWQPVAAHLGGAFRSVAPDLRGHGDSHPPAGWDFGWHGFAEDVLAVVDGLGLDRPVAAGHSSGATALLLAEETRPGTFAAIWCYEPIVVPVDPPLGPDPDSWLAAQARRRREVFASRDEAYEVYSGKPPFSQVAGDALHAYVAHAFEDLGDGSVRLKCRGDDEARVAEMATAHDCFSRLAAVRCPVTLAHGSDADESGEAATFKALAEALPDSRIEVLRGLGHFGPLEDPAAVATSIRGAFT